MLCYITASRRHRTLVTNIKDFTSTMEFSDLMETDKLRQRDNEGQSNTLEYELSVNLTDLEWILVFCD